MKINKISYIGLGLIGGSLASQIKKYHPDIKQYTHASDKTIKLAHSMGITENFAPLPLKELCDVDLIFLCCPIEVNISYLYILKPYLTNKVILTDVGSVKENIHIAVKLAGLSDIFVGGHPMAGSEKTGLENSFPELIDNCRYVLTTEDGMQNEKSKTLFDFISSLNTRAAFMSYKDHDFSAAGISHVPHIIAAALVNMVQTNDVDGFMKDMAAGGFKDTTRISSSSPVIWQQICLANRECILKLLESFKNDMDEFTSALTRADKDEILDFFKRAKDYKDDF